MRRDEVLAILRANRRELAGLGVKSLALFGSTARDQAGPRSDIDLLVEIERPMGLFKFLDIKDYLERILGRHVDLVTREALKPQLRDRILAEAMDAA